VVTAFVVVGAAVVVTGFVVTTTGLTVVVSTFVVVIFSVVVGGNLVGIIVVISVVTMSLTCSDGLASFDTPKPIVAAMRIHISKTRIIVEKINIFLYSGPLLMKLVIFSLILSIILFPFALFYFSLGFNEIS
jgi:hypothetical protein